MNRGWRFCRPLPYHLATAPVDHRSEERLDYRGNPAASTLRAPPSAARAQGFHCGTHAWHYPVRELRSRAHGAEPPPPRLRRPRRTSRRVQRSGSQGPTERSAPSRPEDAFHNSPASSRTRRWEEMERETGFEPATSTLARSHSTTELFPLARNPKRTIAAQEQASRSLGKPLRRRH